MERNPLSSELFHVNDCERSGVPRRSYVFVAEEQILQKLRASPLRGEHGFVRKDYSLHARSRLVQTGSFGVAQHW